MTTLFQKEFNEAIEEGKLKKSNEVAKKLMDILNDKTIAEKCELTIEEVKILRQEYENIKKAELKIKEQIAKNLFDILNDNMIAQTCELTGEQVKILRKEYENTKDK